MSTSDNGKNIAIVSYLTIIGAIIAIFMNSEKKDSFAAFHIRQALGIFVSFFLIGYFIGYFDSWMISSAFYVFYFILWIYGFKRRKRKADTLRENLIFGLAVIPVL